MILDGHVAHRLLRNPAPHHSNAIWVLDELLVESIDRFTGVHRRFGSSVPGPLEARRRSTRRKNTSLASTAYEASPIDVGALFGPGQTTKWWSVPDSADRQPATVDRELSILAIYFYLLTIYSSVSTAFLAHFETSSVASEPPSAGKVCA